MNIQNAKELLHLITPYANKGWAVGTKVMFVSGINNLIGGIIILLITALIVRLFLKYAILSINDIASDKKLSSSSFGRMLIRIDDSNVTTVLFGILGLIGVVTAITSILIFTDIWMYIAIFDPSLALAHHLLKIK